MSSRKNNERRAPLSLPQKQSHTSLEIALEKINNFSNKNGRMPSYAEICTICNIKSKNTAHQLVKKLKSKGFLNIDAKGKLIAKNFSSTNTSPLILLGLVEAGFPTPSEESLHENISLDDWIIEKREASYMLRIKGDSMKDAGILDGDMVIVERTNTAKTGSIVVAELDGNYTVKYLKKGTHGYYLEPANTRMKPIYPKEELKVIAVVKAVVRKY